MNQSSEKEISMNVNVGVPPKTGDFKDVPTDIYEVYVDAKPYEVIPNKFYDPKNDNENKKWQLKWRFIIREKGELEGIPLTYYTGSSLGRHPRNKFTNLIKVVDPAFDIDTAYASEGVMLDKVRFSPLRATVSSIEITGDDGDKRQFPKVTGILPSKLGPLDTSEIMEKSLGATEEPF